MSSIPVILECAGLRRELPAVAEKSPSKLLLGNVSLAIERAEVLAVLGPSGAGKSTFLRLLNRLDEPTGGTVLVDGIDYRTLNPQDLRRRIGMVMQRAFLFPGTIADNVRFGPRQSGKILSDQTVEDLLAQVGLAGFAQRNTLALSGGEAQRVAITRALANEPDIL